MSRRTFVIVGAGLAGAKAAETLRVEGFDGRVVLVGGERERPYERPALSKGYLRGQAEPASVYVHGEGFYAEHDVELLLGRAATGLDAAAREVELDGGERIRYDRLLLATGAEPRRLELPGAGLAGLHYLRTIADADALRSALRRASRLAVVGAGWIGCEVAASARQLGLEVTIVEPSAVPLGRVLGPEVGAVYRRLHEDNGVRVLTESGVEAFEGGESVERVRLAGGEAIDCDAVAVGVGVRPRTELAARAGLAVDNGVLVDSLLRTSDPAVFAAGDVANAEHPHLGGRIRVEHWANALNQGPAAARSMLDAGATYDRLPYFYSDQYDLGMEYSGYALRWDGVVFRGDPEAREFIAFWLDGGRVVAAMNANVWDVTEPLQALIRSGARVDPRRLSDPGVPLDGLAESPAAA
ncbi:MAG TPA: FAD-dependent oxidoreductase [Thermoleophilaceae bacterium]|jgi:3-phenylpropionate/trans-cinnamate dioxygenase ferredoxin reductase subunit